MNDLLGRRILIVDDESLIALHAEDLLTELGAIPVGPASTIEQAFAFINRGEFDAVLLDANLHGQSSQPIARRLAEDGIPFVIVTGYGKLPWLEAKAEVVAKPYGIDEIRTSLRAVLVETKSSP